MSQFQGLTGAWAPLAKQWMQNPYGSQQFGLEQQMGTQQAQNLNQTGTSNLLRNMQASGMQGGASNPAGMEMLQNQGRAATGQQANLGFLNPVMRAAQRQQYAMGQAAGYRPLQTGQTQTEKTGGLGTWLPQVANMALGAAMGMPGMGMGGIPGLPQGQSAGGMMAGMGKSNPWMFSSGAGGAGAFPGLGGPPPSFPGGGGQFNPFGMGGGGGSMW